MTARQLQTLRKRVGWSQDQLAAELKIHPMTVSKWERGVVEIPPIAVLAIRYVTDGVVA